MFVPPAVPEFRMFKHEHLDLFHRTALEILRRTGVRVHHPEALALLTEAGAMVSDETLVRIPASLVEWALNQAPKRIALCRRGTGQAALLLEARETNFGTGSDCQNYLDPETGEARLFTRADIAACARLVDALPEIGFCMSMGEPSDVPQKRRFCEQFALMIENTVKPVVFISGDRADCEAIVAMAAAAAGGEEALRINPTLVSYSQVTTPLVHPRDSLEKLLFMAEKGLPSVHQPSPMMGGTAPVTMAGAMALGHAEVLSGIVIHQLKRPGSPVVYGNGLHHLDMRTSISVYGRSGILHGPGGHGGNVPIPRPAQFRVRRPHGQLRAGRAGRLGRRVLHPHRGHDRPAPVPRRGVHGSRAVHVPGVCGVLGRDHFRGAGLHPGAFLRPGIPGRGP